MLLKFLIIGIFFLMNSINYVYANFNGQIIPNSVIYASDINSIFSSLNSELIAKGLNPKPFTVVQAGQEVSKSIIQINFNLITEVSFPKTIGDEILSSELNTIFNSAKEAIQNYVVTPPEEMADIPITPQLQNSVNYSTTDNYSFGIIISFTSINADGYKVYRNGDCTEPSFNDVSPVPNFSSISFPSSEQGSIQNLTETFSVLAYKDGLTPRCYQNITIHYDNTSPQLTANFPLVVNTPSFNLTGTCDYDDYQKMMEDETPRMVVIFSEDEEQSEMYSQFEFYNSGNGIVMEKYPYPYDPENPEGSYQEFPMSNFFTLDSINKTCNYSLPVHMLTDNNQISGNIIPTVIEIRQADSHGNITKLTSKLITYNPSLPEIEYDPDFIALSTSLCTVQDAQMNGYGFSNIDVPLGLKNNGDTSDCKVLCSTGYAMDETSKSCIIPNENNFNNIRIGRYYGYGGTLLNGASTTIRAASVQNENPSTYYTNISNNALVGFSGEPNAYYPKLIDRFNSNYPLWENENSIYSPSVINFHGSNSSSYLNSSTLRNLFQTEFVSGTYVNGFYGFYSVQFRHNMCFLMGVSWESIANSTGAHAVSLIKSSNSSSSTLSSNVIPVGEENSWTRNECLSIRNLFDAKFNNYYYFSNFKAFSDDYLSIDDVWNVKLDIRFDGTNIKYANEQAPNLLPEETLMKMLQAISLIDDEVDPNYSSQGYSYLKTKNGMKLNGRNVQGVLGVKIDNVARTCNILFKTEGESEWEMVPVLLKDGTSIVKDSPYKNNNCSPLAEKIKTAMGLTNDDVVVKSSTYYTGSAINETTFYYEDVIYSPIAINPFGYNSPHTSVFNFFSLRNGYPIRTTSNYKLHQPNPEQPSNTGNSTGSIVFDQLQQSYPYSFGLNGYVRVADPSNNSPVSFLYGIFVGKMNDTFVDSQGLPEQFKNYSLVFEVISSSGSLPLNNQDQYSFNGSGQGEPMQPLMWQIIAEFNHSLKIIKGLIPEETPAPTGITSMQLLDNYLANDVDSQLQKENHSGNPLNFGAYGLHDLMFYKIKYQ